MAKILIVEDDVNLADSVSDWLTFERYTLDVSNDGTTAMEYLRNYIYDLIILDWELPGMAGIDICRAYRSAGKQTPILFLTGKNSIQDKEAGFEAGADDYLTKPFHPKELIARVRALLRRPPEVTGDRLLIGSLLLDWKAHFVSYKDKEIQLAPREFLLLDFLMRHPSQVFSTEALLERIWPTSAEASVDSVRVCLKRLKAKLGEPSLIENVHGHGYKLAPPDQA